jgi:hypothetical protein
MNRQRKQCKRCPWKVGTDPHQIPDGYCEDKHANLKNTIADGSPNIGGTLRLMACHESTVGRDRPCVGWLANQLGPGNNIALRLAVRAGRVDANFELDGAQHAHFEDTLPKRGARRETGSHMTATGAMDSSQSKNKLPRSKRRHVRETHG